MVFTYHYRITFYIFALYLKCMDIYRRFYEIQNVIDIFATYTFCLYSRVFSLNVVFTYYRMISYIRAPETCVGSSSVCLFGFVLVFLLFCASVGLFVCLIICFFVGLCFSHCFMDSVSLFICQLLR